MHLSILSDSFLSDSLADTRPMSPDASVRVPGTAHRDGVLRGVVVIGLTALLVALISASCIGPNAAADQAVVSFSQSAFALSGMNHRDLRASGGDIP